MEIDLSCKIEISHNWNPQNWREHCTSSNPGAEMVLIHCKVSARRAKSTMVLNVCLFNFIVAV